jgi:hypothetical protein
MWMLQQDLEPQDLGIIAISLKMVEPHLEGDKVADLIFTTLLAMPVLDLISSFNFFYFFSLLVLFSNGG